MENQLVWTVEVQQQLQLKLIFCNASLYTVHTLSLQSLVLA